jgi:hypothetical protein
MKDGIGVCQTIEGYQYNLKRKLVPAQPEHRTGSFQNPKIRYNLYRKTERDFIGQVCLLPWQDGAVITCSTLLPPEMIFARYFQHLKLTATFIHAAPQPDGRFWASSVLPISEHDFIETTEKVHPDLIVVRDPDDNNPPPLVSARFQSGGSATGLNDWSRSMPRKITDSGRESTNP